MIDLRKHFHCFLDRTDDVVHISFEQEHCAVIVSKLRQISDDLAAFFKTFFGLVLRVMNPVGLGIVSTGFRNHIRRAEILCMADNLFEIAHATLALCLVG